MPGNDNVHSSRRNQSDEFYTTLDLIEKELSHYSHYFKGKVVLCNCDDPYESNFFKFFAMNFKELGLKKLISTCYTTSYIVYTQMNLFTEGEIVGVEYPDGRKPYKVELTNVSDENGDGRIDLLDVELTLKKKGVVTLLKGDGDFASPECIELLKEADIVVTNPPFSLFRKYFSLLHQYNKKFLILGNQNAIFYSEILPYFKENKVWLGYNNGHFWFKVPPYYPEKNTDFKIDENGQKWRRMGNISWFTNLEIEKRNEEITLFKHYTPEAYPQYENYKAIEVGATKNIPMDYDGVMGVPISFMQYHNPHQFEVVGATHCADVSEFTESLRTDPRHRHGGIINGKEKYARILIRRIKHGNEV